MGKVFAYAGKLKKYIYSALLFLFLSVVFGVVPFFAISNIAVSLIEGRAVSESYIATVCAVVFGALALKAITMGVGLAHSHTAAFGILYNIRKAKAKDMTEHSLGFIEHNGVGRYKKGFVEDIDLLENLVAHMIPEGVPNILIVLITYIFIFILDWRLGLLSLAIILAGLIPMALMMNYGIKAMPKYYSALDNMNDNIIEYVKGMEVVKVFGKTTGSFEKLKNSIIHARDFTYDWYKVCWRDMSIMNAVMPCTILLALPVGIIFFQNGSVTLNELILTLLLNLSLSAPLIKLMSFMPIFPQVGYAIEKIEATFATTPIKTGSLTESPKNFDIAFSDVCFSYNEQTEVLHGLNVEFKQGELSALVGESGSGKTTITNLIARFWDVNSGSVTIGGVDISKISTTELYKHLSMVFQKVYLFNDTIYNNIALGNENATKEQVFEAARKARCYDFITALPDGFDTMATSGGSSLSGGEKQRISIARAILKDAPIILLDEATASVDLDNERYIQEAINELIKEKTLVVIAHKLSSIKHADNIVVVGDEGIEEQGTHEQLVNSSGTYSELWKKRIATKSWRIEA